MPETDGYELLRVIRSLPAGSKLPAVALTAHADAREAALNAGFQRYKPKPIAPAELVSLIADLAGSTKH